MWDYCNKHTCCKTWLLSYYLNRVREDCLPFTFVPILEVTWDNITTTEILVLSTPDKMHRWSIPDDYFHVWNWTGLFLGYITDCLGCRLSGMSAGRASTRRDIYTHRTVHPEIFSADTVAPNPIHERVVVSFCRPCSLVTCENGTWWSLISPTRNMHL